MTEHDGCAGPFPPEASLAERFETIAAVHGVELSPQRLSFLCDITQLALNGRLAWFEERPVGLKVFAGDVCADGKTRAIIDFKPDLPKDAKASTAQPHMRSSLLLGGLNALQNYALFLEGLADSPPDILTGHVALGNTAMHRAAAYAGFTLNRETSHLSGDFNEIHQRIFSPAMHRISALLVRRLQTQGEPSYEDRLWQWPKDRLNRRRL